ncbi:hypothetical protein H8356DRAFT_1026581 [Neocallimastix lanati (nom. inval.)]|jgi:23S rRNA (adenine(2503)-C(2))-methyltransferase|nr:hypothetical protein H8356DRAFT_1026581 [Neocallimastix sp. JGI-2020a]
MSSRKRKLEQNSIWDRTKVEDLFNKNDIKPIHVDVLYKYLAKNIKQKSWEKIKDFPKAAMNLLNENFVFCTSRVLGAQKAEDGTTKLLIELQDGSQIEEVIMFYDTRNDEKGTGRRRATLCVSCQIGCQMACTFCATGTMGLKGSLTEGEIIEQFVHALDIADISNIVFMGMGEPLNNYNNIKAAIKMLTDSRFFALQNSHITLSTVGVIPRIMTFANDFPKCNLALSLHAPNQELRRKLIPTAKAYKLDKLMNTIKQYQEKTKNSIFIEYLLLHKVNDTEKEARELGELLNNIKCTVNLIPWNSIESPNIDYKSPLLEDILKFKEILKEYNIPSTIRQSKGNDIAGACGQLVVDQSKKGNNKKIKIVDIEDIK